MLTVLAGLTARRAAEAALHHNLRTMLIKRALGVQAYSFDKLNWQKWLLVNLKINRLPKLHIVDRYLQTVAPLGVHNDHQGLDYFVPTTDEVPLDTLPVSHQQGYVAFAIGGQHATKKLPFERLVELCQHLGRPIVLLGGKEDDNTAQRLVEALPQAKLYNACGRYSLNQSASLLKHAQVVYTHDTGLMHMAAALKKPIVSIWGNTVPEFGMYPYLTDFKVWEVKGLNCRPCSKIGYDRCPKGHFRCMNELTFD